MLGWMLDWMLGWLGLFCSGVKNKRSNGNSFFANLYLVNQFLCNPVLALPWVMTCSNLLTRQHPDIKATSSFKAVTTRLQSMQLTPYSTNTLTPASLSNLIKMDFGSF
jgi:hypothetical protein